MGSRRSAVAGIGVTALGMMILSQGALAHEQRAAGKIQMTVGWSTEPAYTGYRNDVQLFLKDGTGKPINDVGDGLKVQVIFGSDKTALSPLDPSYDPDTGLGTPGEYDQAIIPTRPGHYTFHFVGVVHGQRIDQSFASSEKTFNPVEDARAAEFPAKDPSQAQLAGLVERLQPRVDAARTAAQDASGGAAQARSLAVIGIVLGAIGTVIGVWPRRGRGSR
ncbi:MAG TPA: hypothetical protein VGX97_02405 [bacterium]|nr:hypothetical protein [bacterium]